MLSASEKQQLEEQGYLILPDFLTPAEVRQFNERVEELFAEEGDQAGGEFKSEPGARRLANAVDKGEIFERVIETPKVLECMEAVLGPDFKLSSLNIRSANPHNETAQPLHADSGALPDVHGDSVCNSVWMLDDFTEHNGALRIVPGSHRWGRLARAGREARGRDAGHRKSRHGGHHEFAYVARRKREQNRPSAPRHACLLHSR